MDTKRLFDADAPAVYAATGHLLFIREGKLLAQDFDPDRLETGGDPFPIADHVTGGTTLSASAAGPIAYRTPSADSGQRQLVWVDRSGKEIEKVVYQDTASQGPSLSRDGRVTNVGSTAINTNRQQYAVFPDGQSFVMNSVLGEASTSPITVIMNWKPKP